MRTAELDFYEIVQVLTLAILHLNFDYIYFLIF